MPETPPSSNPAFFAELFDSIEYQTDGVVFTARRRFRVPAIGRDAIDSPGVPHLRDEHPRCPGVFCDRLVCGERLDQYSSVVEAYYSNNRRFTQTNERPPNDTTRAYLRLDPERADLTIPFFIATKRSLPRYSVNGAGQQVLDDVATGWEWVRNDLKYPMVRWILSRDVYVQTFDFATSNAVYAQIGQIHRFPDNSSWEMLPPSIRQTAANMWSIGYQWRTEMLIPVPGLPNRPGEGSVPADATIPSDVLSRYFVTATEPRPPHYGYQVIPGAYEIGLSAEGVDISVPAVRVFDRFPDLRNNSVNPAGLGWATLPGRPLDEYV